MVSVFIWIVTMAIAISTLALAAAAEAHGLHVAVTSLISLCLVVIATNENQRPIESASDAFAVVNSNTRFMGAIWAFSAGAIAVTYGSILQWAPWQLYVLGLSGIAVLCLCSANLMANDRASADLYSSIRMARLLSIVQLVAAAAAIASFWWSGRIFAGGGDWAANNILLFTALSIAVLSIISLRSYAAFLAPIDLPQRAA